VINRSLEAGELARALNISPDSVGRYARDGRIPFDLTPGGHRRFNVDEVRRALGVAGEAAPIFSVPSATLRARAIRGVTTLRTASATEAAVAAEAVGGSAAEELLSSAWRVQRSVPLATA
jgi:excisionase family DNA binding protein